MLRGARSRTGLRLRVIAAAMLVVGLLGPATATSAAQQASAASAASAAAETGDPVLPGLTSEQTWRLPDALVSRLDEVWQPRRGSTSIAATSRSARTRCCSRSTRSRRSPGTKAPRDRTRASPTRALLLHAAGLRDTHDDQARHRQLPARARMGERLPRRLHEGGPAPPRRMRSSREHWRRRGARVTSRASRSRTRSGSSRSSAPSPEASSTTPRTAPRTRSTGTPTSTPRTSRSNGDRSRLPTTARTCSGSSTTPHAGVQGRQQQPLGGNGFRYLPQYKGGNANKMDTVEYANLVHSSLGSTKRPSTPGCAP